MPRLYENRIIGPPGTGKTSTLARYVRETVEKYGSDAVIVASFTKAAAAEIAGRDLPVAPSQVGTLHHFAYTALDHPDVAETKIPDWNERQEAAGRPHFKLTPSKRDLDDMDEDLGTEAEGDELYNRLEIYRARMVDRRTWDSEVLSFAAAWETWKREARVIDFTDMIEMALLATDEAPGAPRVGFMDESQDFTPLEMALVRKWGAQMETLFVVGDPQQCLSGNSLIALADGTQQTIKALVDARAAIEVLSYNVKTRRIEPKIITGWHRVPLGSRRLVELGRLGVTEDHPVFTPKGWQPAGHIDSLQSPLLYLDHAVDETRDGSARWRASWRRLDNARQRPEGAGRDGASSCPGCLFGLEVPSTQALSQRAPTMGAWGLALQHTQLCRAAALVPSLPPRWGTKGCIRGHYISSVPAGPGCLADGRWLLRQGSDFSGNLWLCGPGAAHSLFQYFGLDGQATSEARCQGRSATLYCCGQSGDYSAGQALCPPQLVLQSRATSSQRAYSELVSLAGGDPETTLPLLSCAYGCPEFSQRLHCPSLPTTSASRSLSPLEDQEEPAYDRCSLCYMPQALPASCSASSEQASPDMLLYLPGKVRTSDQAQAGLSAQSQGNERSVYCLDVADNHNFFANRILVHNCIYAFKGASPEAFRNPPVPKSQQKVLDQSYRLPRQVHALAQRWIAQESTPFEYKPRDYEGEVRFEDSLSFRFPESLLVDAAKYLELGKTVMFLTTCGYMLDNLRHLLLEQGIPFHNPFRYSQPAWNPLHPGRGVASKDRLLAYLRPDPSASDRPQRWSPDDLKLWTAALRAEGTLRRGAKTALEGSGGGGECSDDFLEELFEAQSLARALDLDLDWLEQNLLSSRRKGMEFPLRVARRWGARKLRDTPQTIVGTIHSTKGGEASVVYLCPDIAVPAMEQWEAGGEGRNAIVRQIYVGITRAKSSLIICGPSSNLAVEIA